jgi:glycosyltransferase involved in cell wall biosynthesis
LDPEITILMNTCRDDFPLVGLRETFIFEPTVKSLNKQEEQNFELVVVDALHSHTRERWIKRNAGFPVKYLSAHPNRFLEKGLCAIASMKNKGLLYAEGELVVFIDDCTQFPPWWTRKIWKRYTEGYWPMSLTYYYEAGRPKLLGESSKYVERFYGREYDKEENLYTFLKRGDVVRDSRAKYADRAGEMKAPGSWFYGGSSAELDALIRINGIDEHFDGKKGLEDSDTGMRLEAAGYTGLFLVDKELYHVENWHTSISQRVLHYTGPTPACNYALLQYNQLKAGPRANTKILTMEDCEWIRDHICPNCKNLERCRGEEFKGRFFTESEGFDYWLRSQRVFDLREERMGIEL